MGLVKGIVSTTLVAANTVIVCIPLFVMAAVRLVLPTGGRRRMSQLMDRIVIDGWVGINRLIFKLLRLTRVHVTWDQGDDLSRNRWYVVISNHQGWADILLLQNTLHERIPAIKFFTKQQLITVPFVGVAMWLLGFPYVRRLSKDQIARNPKLLDVDRQATLKACEGFMNHPTTVLNFLEGTRFTPAKHQNQNARFRHLLNPKVGGLGYVTTALSSHLHKLVDVTIVYPEGTPTFWEFMQGQCGPVDMLVQCRDIPDEVRHAQDERLQRQALATWIETLWREKDERLAARARQAA